MPMKMADLEMPRIVATRPTSGDAAGLLGKQDPFSSRPLKLAGGDDGDRIQKTIEAGEGGGGLETQKGGRAARDFSIDLPPWANTKAVRELGIGSKFTTVQPGGG